MSQLLAISPVGLDIFHNELSKVPQGSLLQADNVVIDRDGVIESRRGLSQYGALGSLSTAIPNQLMYYKNRILGQIADALYFDDGTGTFDQFSGVYNEVVPGLRMKYVESNGNLYFTTALGIKKIGAVTSADFTTAPNFIVPAGVVPAISNEVWLDYSSSGWLPGGSVVGYEVVWGYTDLNTNVLLGDPSAPVEASSDNTILLINSFNQMLLELDEQAVGGYTAYYTSFSLVPGTSTATNFFNNLEALAAKLDVQLNSSAFSGVRSIVSSTPLGSFSGDTTATMSTISNIASTAGMIVGAGIYDALYNLLGTITIINSANQITISNPIVGTATSAQFYYGGANVNLTASQTLITTTAATNMVAGNTIAITGAAVVQLNGTSTIVAAPSADNIVVPVATISSGGAGGQIQNTTAASFGNDTAPQTIPIGSDFTNLYNFFNALVTALAGVSVTVPFASTTSNVFIKINIPATITTSFFYQIYRTAIFTQTATQTLEQVVIDSEYRLVFEGNPTAAQIAAGSITYLDVTPESFRDAGAPLYTNPNTGQGIQQTNDRPPLAQDLCLFYSNVWYANTSTRHSIELQLLSVEAMVSGVSTITISDGVVSNTYTFVDGAAQVQSFTTLPGTSLGGTYFTVSSARNRTNYYVWYNTGASIDPAPAGLVGIEVDILAGDTDILVAEKTAAALNSNVDFSASTSSGNTVTINWTDQGPATAAADHNTGFTFNAPSTMGTGEDAATKDILLSTASSVGQAIDETAQSMIRVINADPASVVYVYYLSTASTLPGLLYFQRKDITNTPTYITANDVATADEFNPTLGVTVTGNTTATSAVITNLSTTTGFMVGEAFSGPNIPIGATISTIDSGTQITLTLPASTTVIGASLTYGAPAVTNNEQSPNRMYYSKDGQPEAVPLLNFIDIGPKDKAILRIIPLRESLMVFKQDAIYRITGNSAITGFTSTLFDSSTIVLAPDSAAVLNNQVYAYTQQGVAVVSETGVSIISRPIESAIIKLRQYTDAGSIIFGVTYEADRAYLLFLPTVNGDTVATQCYRYNTFTQTWTRFVITKNCGVVLPNIDVLFLGDGISSFVNKERKNFERQDYADSSHLNSIEANTLSTVGAMTLGSSNKITVGDVVVQTQYLTISQFDRLLRKLDADDHINNPVFYSTLAAPYGVDMFSQLLALASLLDTTLGGSTYTTIVNGFTDTLPEQQLAFNAVIAQLNIAGLQYTDYLPSTGTNTFDANILSINFANNSIVVNQYIPFVAGDCLTYEHIACTTVTVPQTFGNPTMYRQVYEGTFIFENDAFIGATVGFASDLFPNIQTISFGANGNGVWGEFDWGGDAHGTLWGGSGTGVPFRTYVPRQKQRCRWIKAQFQHINAWNEFAFYGISLVYNDFSTRAYR